MSNLAGSVVGVGWTSDHVAANGGNGSVELAVADSDRVVVGERLALGIDLASELALVRCQAVKVLQDGSLILAIAGDEFLKWIANFVLSYPDHLLGKVIYTKVDRMSGHVLFLLLCIHPVTSCRASWIFHPSLYHRAASAALSKPHCTCKQENAHPLVLP